MLRRGRASSSPGAWVSCVVGEEEDRAGEENLRRRASTCSAIVDNCFSIKLRINGYLDPDSP